jgi:DNA end-binding protein Ku
MAPRATFKGFIRLSLVSVPVKAFTATNTSAEIRLNQLHANCNSRIKYLKSCPTHGVVTNDEIVSGFEYAKDQYVVIDPEEVSKLRKESERAVDIQGFIHRDMLDAIYFSGRTYYVLPDGPAGNKPFALLHKAMVDGELYAIATAILSGREQMVVIRPIDELLGMSVLSYDKTIKKPEQFTDELKSPKITDEEMKLTRTLIEASTLEELDMAAYQDEYVEKLRELIQAKVDGQEVVAAPNPEEPKVINLMEALKASVENAQRGGAGKTSAGRASGGQAAKAGPKKVQPKLAPSTRERTAAKRKKKSG